jgi:hypothetical protein
MDRARAYLRDMRRWLLIAALMASACSGGDGAVPVPDITDPTCGWVQRESIEAGDMCLHLRPGEGAETRFLSEADSSCQGSRCLLLRPGERAVVIGPIDTPYADYDLDWVMCDVPEPECIP